jgi:WD40 repeat protein
MNLQIQLQFLSLDQHKLSAVELHPIKPWVATANDLGVVRLWDYETQKLVHKFSITDLDDQEKEGQALQLSLERDPTYKGPKVMSSRPPDAKKKQIGEIKYIKFVDTEVKRLKRKIEVRSGLPCCEIPISLVCCPNWPAPFFQRLNCV